MSNWGGTYEFCLKADLAAALGKTKPRNIAKDDADVAPTGNLEVNGMFSPGPSIGEDSGHHVMGPIDPSLTEPLSGYRGTEQSQEQGAYHDNYYFKAQMVSRLHCTIVIYPRHRRLRDPEERHRLLYKPILQWPVAPCLQRCRTYLQPSSRSIELHGSAVEHLESSERC